ncbi:hypothetical protein PRIPAC_91875 [Pristionchus pacificus]|nr:hypothetical protein PRIPAC_91875 [Pristionchus pacificus]
MSAAAAAPLANRPRRNSSKPSPLDPSIVAASNAVESPGLKSPMTPNRRAMKKDEGPPRSAPPLTSPIPSLGAVDVSTNSSTSPKTPTAAAAAEQKKAQQPSTSRQIPPNLDLSNPATPTTPNPSLRSPRPPIKSAHFDALEAEGERDAMVRTLVLQLQKEMQDEIDRLTFAHRKVLEEKNAEFQALAELLSKKREEWSLQMAAKITVISDQQHDIVGFLKSTSESTLRIRSLENELESERHEKERLRTQLDGFTKPCSSKSFMKPRDPPADEELMILSTSNKDSDGFEKPSTNARKAVKRPATDN